MNLQTGHKRSVSVIIPAKDEEEFILRCIASVKAAVPPSFDVEILVVDNGSVDSTAELAVGAGVRLIDFPIGSIASVRNQGAKEATGQVLAYIDADCVCGHDWFEAAEILMNREEVGAVGGVCLAPEDHSWVEAAWVSEPSSTERVVGVLAGSSLFVSRETFDQVGGFRDALYSAEDDDFSKRIEKLGKELLSIPEAEVFHLDYPKNIREFYAREKWHGENQQQLGKAGMPLLLATIAFGFSLMASVFSLFLESTEIAVAMITFCMAICFAFSARRSLADYRRGGAISFRNLVRRFLLFLVYFFARFHGLVRSALGRSSSR